NVFFVQIRTGLEGSLRWLDTYSAQAIEALPRTRELSIYEASLFCLSEHLEWRKTMSVAASGLVRACTRFRCKACRTTHRVRVRHPAWRVVESIVRCGSTEPSTTAVHSTIMDMAKLRAFIGGVFAVVAFHSGA